MISHMNHLLSMCFGRQTMTPRLFWRIDHNQHMLPIRLWLMIPILPLMNIRRLPQMMNRAPLSQPMIVTRHPASFTSSWSKPLCVLHASALIHGLRPTATSDMFLVFHVMRYRASMSCAIGQRTFMRQGHKLHWCSMLMICHQVTHGVWSWLMWSFMKPLLWTLTPIAMPFWCARIWREGSFWKSLGFILIVRSPSRNALSGTTASSSPSLIMFHLTFFTVTTSVLTSHHFRRMSSLLGRLPAASVMVSRWERLGDSLNKVTPTLNGKPSQLQLRRRMTDWSSFNGLQSGA